MTGKVYGDYLADNTGWQLINHSILAACNRRIIRTTIRNLEQLLLTNSPDNICCIVQLTNQIRGEVWLAGDQLNQIQRDREKYLDNVPDPQFTKMVERFNEVGDGDYYGWSSYQNTFCLENLPHFREHHKYTIEFNNNPEQYFYDVFTETLLLSSYLKANKIKYLIYHASLPENPEQIIKDIPWLEVLYNKIKLDPAILNLTDEVFLNWAWANNHNIFDKQEYDGHFGHPDTVAHAAWAELLYQKLKTIYEI